MCVDCHGAHNVRPPSALGGCLGCHRTEITLRFGDGTSQPMRPSTRELESSVHGELACGDCHQGYSGSVHPEASFPSLRLYRLAAGEICKECHADKYSRTLEGIHYRMISQGRIEAPSCMDCHGSHAITAGAMTKVAIAARCKTCHEPVYELYRRSVHGAALIEEGNSDVPVCSDCHQAHEIRDPDSSAFHHDTPTLCGDCHADEDRMEKYGLSTSVVSTYLASFHGITATFYQGSREEERLVAVCTDCHGIHDITKTDGPEASIIKSNLVARCQKCHPDAKANFPDTWISHYEPSLVRTPMVFAVRVFYRVFIPFMMAGLLLQVLLHVWRYSVRR
jgi:hypothetical protein